MIGLFALWPLGNPMFRPWQLLTYAFLHDPQTFLHIFFNMFALYMFGRTLETYWGGRRFLIYYLVCALAAGITQLATTQPDARLTRSAPPAAYSACCSPSPGTSPRCASS